MKPNSISLHASAAGSANLRTYIRAAQAAGFDCIEPTKTQLNDFLNAGYRPEHIRSLLGPLEITSVGWLSDLDRHGCAFTGMMHEAEALFSLAASVGSMLLRSSTARRTGMLYTASVTDFPMTAIWAFRECRSRCRTGSWCRICVPWRTSPRNSA